MHLFYIRKRFALLPAAMLLLLVLLFVGGFLLFRTAAVGSGERLVPVYEVATGKQAVAISFDASWGAEYTETILDTLDAYGVKTTFFLVNIWMEDYPELTREICTRGHEIGLHSASHPEFPSLSVKEMERELTENSRMVQELTGYCPGLFRPPFGAYDNDVIETVHACGLEAVQWSIDSLDWKNLTAQEIYDRVMKDISGGDIVLFHNNGLHTAEALEMVLEGLQQRGLEVIPVGELLWQEDYYIDSNGIQRQIGAAEDAQKVPQGSAAEE